MPFMERTLGMRNGGNNFFMGDMVSYIFLQQQLGPKIKDTSLVLMKMYIFICARVQRKNQAYTFSNMKTKTKQTYS